MMYFALGYMIAGLIAYVSYIRSRFSPERDYGTDGFGVWSMHRMDLILAFLCGPAAWFVVLIVTMIALGYTINKKTDE